MLRGVPLQWPKFAGGSVASRPVPSSGALGLGSQPLTCKAVIEPLEGTLGFLKPFGHRGPEGESDTRGHRTSYWHGQESTFSHCATCGKGSAGPPSPEVTLGGLSSAPNPALPSQSPSTAPFGGGGGRRLVGPILFSRLFPGVSGTYWDLCLRGSLGITDTEEENITGFYFSIKAFLSVHV